MRRNRVSISVLGVAAGLAAVLSFQTDAYAAAKVKSHSNTNNNRAFNSACSSAGGKVDIAEGRSTCVLPSIAVKGEGVPHRLRAACIKDGGKVAEENGTTTCDGG